MQNHNDRNVVYAGFFVRLAAFIVDSIIVAIGLLLLRFPFFIIRLASPDLFIFEPFVFMYSIKDIIFYFLGVSYFVFFTYLNAATPGKKLFKLQVISLKSEKLTLFTVLYRETIGRYLSSVILCIGYIIVGIDEKKRGLHDVLCDTTVVYKGVVQNSIEQLLI